MSNVATLPIEADRYVACVRQIYLRGLDLSGVPMRAQVRMTGDTPGTPLVDLQTVTNGNAEGLRLVGVETVDGLPISHVQMVINETTMEALPYAGELGSATELRWDWQLTLSGRKQRIARGDFIITGDGVTGADNAPSNRPAAWSRSFSPTGGMRTGATLTFGDEIIAIEIDGASLLAPMVKQAQDARDAVKPLFGTGAPSPAIGIEGSAYYDITDPMNPVLYGPKTSAGWGVGRGLKGNPGGNVMAVGPLSSASALAIAAGTPVVQTSSNATVGDRGGARYERVSSSDVAAGLPGTFTSSDTGQRWQIAEIVFNAAMFGYRGDDTGTFGSDNTQALRDCIAAATRLKVRTIQIPWGTTGQGRCDDSIVDGDLAPGMCFIGESRGMPNGEYGPGVRLHYTGDKAMWNIIPTDTNGWWTWEDLVFICSSPKGSAFDINDTLNHGVVSDTGSPFKYVITPRWSRCLFYGAHAGANQTGDAIRAAKMFNSTIDHLCFSRGWNYAVWLLGCDNNTIGMRAELNGQHIRVEASGTFGNDNTIESRFLGNTNPAAFAEQYGVWDSGNRTSCLNNSFENNSPNGRGAYYFNGHGTVVQGPQFACKFWVAGPFAREVKIHDPHVRTFRADWKPTFDKAASFNFGGNQSDYRIRVVGTSHNFRAIAGDNPRLLVADPDAMPDSRPSQFVAMAAGHNGVLGQRQHILNPLNWGWQNSEGTEASAGIDDMLPDIAASTGWIARIAPKMNGGMSAERMIGRDIPPSVVAISVRAKVSATKGWVALVKRIKVNGEVATEAHSLSYGTGGSFNVDRFTLDMRSWAIGDRFVYLIYNAGGADGNIDLDYLRIAAVEPEITPINVAPTAADYNALLGLLRSAEIMA